MKTIYVQAKFIRPELRKQLRDRVETMVSTGAKLYANKIGAVWHYHISGYHWNGDDVSVFSWAALPTDPKRTQNEGDTDGDYIYGMNYLTQEKLRGPGVKSTITW